MTDNIALVQKCMEILCDSVGVVDTERFICFIKTENFDYTKWQREYYDKISPEKLREDSKKYNEEHPFIGKKAKKL